MPLRFFLSWGIGIVQVTKSSVFSFDCWFLLHDPKKMSFLSTKVGSYWMFMSVLVFDQFIDNHQIRFKIILPLSSSRDTSIFVNVLFCMWHSAELKALHKQSCEIGFPSSFSRSHKFYLFQTQDMKKYALSLIVRHFPKVAPLPKLRTLSHSLLLDILRALADDMAEHRTLQMDVSLNLDSASLT